MRKRNSLVVLMLLLLLGAASLVSCRDSRTILATIDPATIEALLLQKVDNIQGLGEALHRMLVHLGGAPQPGVNLVPTPDGGTGTVEVDLDGDGFRESTVTGTLTWNNGVDISLGALIEITELTGNIVHMTASLMPVGPTQVMFSDIVANVPVEGSRPEVTVSAGEITVDAGTVPPTLTGFADFAVGGEPATMYLMDDGMGNLSIVVEGNGFIFTVP